MREVPCNDELTDKDRQRIAEDDSIIYVFHSSKGATVYAHDNYLRTRTPEQRKADVDNMYRVANRIIGNYCKRKVKELMEKGEA